EDETIAKLAVGVRRFKLPDDQNFIKLYRENKNYRALAEIFQNRRQYDKALEMWRVELERIGNVEHGWRKVVVASIDQIEKPWGQFEPVMTQPTSEDGASVDFRFRNGKQVQFEAHEVKVKELLDDVMEYIESKPNQLNWE
ncbi:TPA: hypothetical protein DDW35_05250, partial [Candidatus Sumerlaeota bacterium]|nr:hypothetical protein [Candidatus Sumerlaeota bacterium]